MCQGDCWLGMMGLTVVVCEDVDDDGLGVVVVDVVVYEMIGVCMFANVIYNVVRDVAALLPLALDIRYGGIGVTCCVV